MIKYPQAALNLLVTRPGAAGRNGRFHANAAIGFSLVELLVVFVIIAVLSAIAFPLVRSWIGKGHSAKCMANLRDIGVRITGDAFDKGHYAKTTNGVPLWDVIAGWSGGSGRDPVWCCPARLIKKGSGNPPFTPAYSANDRVFPTEGLRVAAVQRPEQVIVLIDAGQRMPSGWAFHQMMVKGATNPANANVPLQGKPITAPNTDIATGGACVRYRHQGKANALFLDGHVEAMKMGSILEKHISISY